MNNWESHVTLPDHSQSSVSDDLRVGYQAAVQMAVYDGQLSWQVTGLFVQFAILMIAGAVFPSFVGSDDTKTIAFAGLAVSFAGLTMTGMFGSMIMRMRTYEEYWVLCAKNLESYLPKEVTVFEGSSILSIHGKISIGKEIVRMRPIAAVKSKVMLNTFFMCFLVTFLVLIIINVQRLLIAHNLI